MPNPTRCCPRPETSKTAAGPATQLPLGLRVPHRNPRKFLILHRSALAVAWSTAFPNHDFGTGRLRRYSLDSFERACDRAEAEWAGKHRSGSDRLPHDWPDMSLDALWGHLNAPGNEAPKSTYDALFFELSAYGLSQLTKPNCQRRLAALSTAQVRTIIQALIRSRAKNPNITDELIAKLGDQL
jgi:hypothetical protein